MGCCKTCKYWKYEDKDTRARGCENEKLGGDYDDFVFDRRAPTDELAVFVDEGGWALWTGPDFGCVHHEERG